jgi:hypothetical protein
MNNLIIQILINLFVMVTSYLLMTKRDRWKFREENKQKHLSEIKEEVLLPLINILEGRWLPLLERKVINLDIKSIEKYEKDPVTSIRVSIEYIFVTWDISIHPNLNLYLYKHAMDNHYAQILEEYEAFKLKGDEYIKSCLSYAKEIKEQISQRRGLPKYNPLPSRKIYEEEWIKSGHLARFIVKKQIVPGDEHLGLNFEANSAKPSLTLVRDGTFEECALTSNPAKIKEIIEKILKKRDKAEELISFADKLKINYSNLINEMKDFYYSSELIGDCEFIKF